MGGRDLDQRGLTVSPLTRKQLRAAALQVADQVGGEHPHPDDDTDPRKAGRELAHNPIVRDEVLELLAAIGMRP
ncbi:hypothetical protein [Streptomyces canus]|uniref:hypothetical protein n=1 Tax=Streptomyces canus TaxID=58343 RepID=UPI00277E0B3D|nr:hypothetical protein [Streptomyces canus]MDQ0758766.1 hypothetical protein [Streptomyces canus]